MSEFAFPFPNMKLAEKELCYDPCYSKIPKDKCQTIAKEAWQVGEEAARNIFSEFDGLYDFFAICKRSKLIIELKGKDNVVGNQRYFSDYVSGKNTITLYEGSIKQWAKQNGMELREAENTILSHEYFHFLEWTKLGLTSRNYQVPMITIGKFNLGKTGIRALSEIGAHGFARTYFDLCQMKMESSDKGED